MVYTDEDLKRMQAWSLDRKIQVTQTRIIEYYQHYEGFVYISFSGGKDSTVLLDIARKIYPDIEGLYIDTGLEYPEIKDFVKCFDNITWVKPKMRFDEVIKKHGYPIISKEIALTIEYARKESQWATDRLDGKHNYGNHKKYKFLLNSNFKISPKCCDIMKKNPAKSFEKLTNKHPILGTMASEGGQRASGYKQSGCNSFNKKRGISVPMGFWTEQDVLTYLKRYNLPMAKIYGDIVEKNKDNKTVDLLLKTTGVSRTGCMFCGFGCHLEKEPNRFQRIKTSHPKQYEYIMRPFDENGLGFKEVLDFINVKYE